MSSCARRCTWVLGVISGVVRVGAFHFDGVGETPRDIVPNDFFGIRDLLVLGQAAPFMSIYGDSAGGVIDVEKNAIDFLYTLPTLHPHPPCREQIAAAIGLAGSFSIFKPNDQVEYLWRGAQAAWDCLPAKFTEHSFDHEDPAEEMINYNEKNFNLYKIRMPRLKDPSVLGACRHSSWPRACSYWVSAHAMAYRADALGENMAREYLHSIIALFAGGALLCHAATEYTRMIFEGVLTSVIFNDYMDGFSSGPQCTRAKHFIDELWPCLNEYSETKGQVSQNCSRMEGHITRASELRKYVTLTWKKDTSASGVLVAFHNLVSHTIGQDVHSGKRRLYCLRDVFEEMPNPSGLSVKMPLLKASTNAPRVLGLSSNHSEMPCLSD